MLRIITLIIWFNLLAILIYLFYFVFAFFYSIIIHPLHWNSIYIVYIREIGQFELEYSSKSFVKMYWWMKCFFFVVVAYFQLKLAALFSFSLNSFILYSGYFYLIIFIKIFVLSCCLFFFLDLEQVNRDRSRSKHTNWVEWISLR